MHSNRLINESSPYLLQHAHNPVDWYPWGQEAFAKARTENKPIFISVGYSTCHWCHVMRRESFEDETIAAIMNRHFVNIKIDREERPDVDRVYMTYVQALTGGAGWPMNVWLTPDLKPFTGGTYFPPEDMWGRTGFKTVLLRVARAWEKDRERLVASAGTAIEQLRSAVSPDGSGDGAFLDSDLIDRTYARIKDSYDSRYGGFGDAPKFPRPSVPDFLLRYHARAGAQDALEMTVFTLRAMADGGIHDQLGGGFHRYSVDERWRVPHFEKMLYDQAQIACTYLDAYRITRDERLALTARGILDYVLRDMTGDQGQFYSAEDADSPLPENPETHAEGAFYAWEHGAIVALLGAETASVFNFRYGVEENGNVLDDPHGYFSRKNVLFVARGIKETAQRFKTTPDIVGRTLAEARQRLFAARALRPRPHRDDKTITAWNGLTISAFAHGYQVLNEKRYLAAAIAAAAFVHDRLYDAKRGILLRRYRDGDAAIEGYADDYAFLIRGLLDLYETSFDIGHLTWAIALQETQNALFRDGNAGGYFSTAGDDKAILLRIKEDYDGAEPSPNSIAVLNLLRLALMTDNAQYTEMAAKTVAAFASRLSAAPHAMPQMMAGLDYYLDKPKQILIAGRPDAEDTRTLIRVVHENFIPNKIVMLADGDAGQQALARNFELIASIHPIGGKAAAYICENNVCKLPTIDPKVMGAHLGVSHR